MKSDTITLPFYPVFRSAVHYEIAPFTHLRASLGQGVRYPSVAERFTLTSVGGLNIYSFPLDSWYIGLWVETGPSPLPLSLSLSVYIYILSRQACVPPGQSFGQEAGSVGIRRRCRGLGKVLYMEVFWGMGMRKQKQKIVRKSLTMRCPRHVHIVSVQ